jgi:endogenous inhibitor of DNA gyrase (YacG/DUF329 family)
MDESTVQCPDCETPNSVDGHREARDAFPEKAGECPNCGTDITSLVFSEA